MHDKSNLEKKMMRFGNNKNLKFYFVNLYSDNIIKINTTKEGNAENNLFSRWLFLGNAGLF